jgi:MFS family permease
MSPDRPPWYKELTRYHWFVFVVAALGWLFDTMDQQLFTLARAPAMRELLQASPTDPRVGQFGGYATSVFLAGWATGGIAFGVLGDRIGRAKTMLWTILIYSLFTGLSAFSVTVYDFALYRFLTGLGVGGEFAVGVALVAEVMPERARPFALGLLQALSAVGNISAALISMALGQLQEAGLIASSWRGMFVVGTVPALLALLIRRRLKEPERWQAVAGDAVAKRLGSYGQLFGDPRWRKHALLGLALAFSGVVGLWGIGFFSPDLNRLVFRKTFEQEERDRGAAAADQAFVKWVVANPEALDKYGATIQPNHLLSADSKTKDAERIYATALALHKAGQTVTVDRMLEELDRGDPNPAKKMPPQTAEDRGRRAAYLAGPLPPADEIPGHAEKIVTRTKKIEGRLTFWASVTSMMLNIGAFFGIYAFSRITHIIGRRLAFAISFVMATLSTAFVFWSFQTIFDVFWMMPLMGFCQLSLFGGYAIYFPELFPTHLRSTGTSFCYNVGRLVAMVGPSALGLLQSVAFADKSEPMRYAGVTMCSVFLLGLFALPFVPETKGQPLPE